MSEPRAGRRRAREGLTPLPTVWWEGFQAPWRFLVNTVRSSVLRRVLWALLLVSATTGIYLSVSLTQQVHLKVGQIAPRDFYAPRTFENVPETDAARAAAAAAVPTVDSPSSTVIANATSAFQTAMGFISQERQSLTPSSSSSSASGSSPADSLGVRLATAAAVLRQDLGLTVLLPNADYQAVLLANGQTLQSVEQQALADLGKAMSAGVTAQDLSADRASLEESIRELSAPPGVVDLLAQVAGQVMVADMEPNPVATAAAQRQAAAAVRPIHISTGEIIVARGSPVTAADITNLENAGLLQRGGPLGLVATASGLAILLALACWAYLRQFHPDTLGNDVQLLLFGGMLVVVLGATRMAMPNYAFLAPTAWAAMLATAAFGPGVALFVGALGGVSAGILADSLPVALSACASAWAAIFALRRLGQRGDFIRAGVLAALAGAAITALVSGPLLGESTGGVGALLRAVIPSAATGLLSAFLAIGTLPLAEAMGVLTPFRLQELGDSRQGLLHRLSAEAVGTYHHSLMVANLAEAACQAVGADALLARTAALYHDIGKLKRPAFFVENQLGGENPHDQLSPRLSAMVIRAHVRDGVEMARRARLPRELIDFIRTHHGTTLTGYFYHAAKKAAEAEAAAGGPVMEVAEEDYRYEGPLPSTRETAILMLADSVEAAVRSLKQPTAVQIEEMIQHILTDRLQDGQLDAAPLTLRDVNTISITFRRILLGAYHARIEYPEQLAEQVGGRPAGVRQLPRPAEADEQRRSLPG